MTTWYRGETIDYELAIDTVIGLPLIDAIEIEMQMKTLPGDADPPLMSLSMTGGDIVLRDQVGDDIDKADVRIPFDSFEDVPAGTYYVDVVVLWPANIRHIVIKPFKVKLKDGVNAP